MNQRLWSDVDTYISDRLLGDDRILAKVLANNEAAGLPAIDVSPAQGKLLSLLATIAGAKRILEIGTLGGYSSIWLARALPEGGELITLELDPHHAQVARQNLALARVDDRVRVIEGRAVENLATLAESDVRFDFVFIDADKPSNPTYLRWALELGRPGAVIIVDNVVRGGRLVEAQSSDPAVQGTRALFDGLAAERRIEATAIQTVGAKGYDGWLVGRIRE